jgi:hypothetical protein
MPDASLDGCRAKLERAHTHLQALYDELNAFTDGEPYELVRQHDPKSRTDDVFVKVHREPDALLWGVLLGDFLHNTRSALDHLVWQLVLLDGGKPGRDNAFPIALSGPGYWCQRKDGGPSMRDSLLKGVAEDHRAIIDVVQPYRSGNAAKLDLLAILADFSNVDKHRLVHPTIVVIAPPQDSDFDVRASAPGGLADIEISHGPLVDGAKVMSVRYSTDDPDARVNMHANVTVGIGLGDRGLRPEFLDDIWAGARLFVESFAEEFSGQS